MEWQGYVVAQGQWQPLLQGVEQGMLVDVVVAVEEVAEVQDVAEDVVDVVGAAVVAVAKEGKTENWESVPCIAIFTTFVVNFPVRSHKKS